MARSAGNLGRATVIETENLEKTFHMFQSDRAQVTIIVDFDIAMLRDGALNRDLPEFH